MELTVTLARLRALLGMHRVTLWRHLRRRGAQVTGHRVTLAELHRAWPEVATAVEVAAMRERQLRCPRCGGDLHLSCAGCHCAIDVR